MKPHQSQKITYAHFLSQMVKKALLEVQNYWDRKEMAVHTYDFSFLQSLNLIVHSCIEVVIQLSRLLMFVNHIMMNNIFVCSYT